METDLRGVEGRMDYNSQKPLVELSTRFMGYCPVTCRELWSDHLFASLYLLRLSIQRCLLSWTVTLSQVGQSFRRPARSWRPCPWV